MDVIFDVSDHLYYIIYLYLGHQGCAVCQFPSFYFLPLQDGATRILQNHIRSADQASSDILSPRDLSSLPSVSQQRGRTLSRLEPFSGCRAVAI